MSNTNINEIHTVKVTKKPKPNNQQPSALRKRPKTSEMVLSAIRILNEKGGSSLHAIKKFLTGTYSVDTGRSGIYIKSFLKQAVENGELIQTRGKGAAGSFKINAKAPPKSPKKKAAAKKVAHRKSLTKVVTKVTAGLVKKPKVTKAKAANSSNGKLAESKAKNLKSPKPSSSKSLAKPKK